MDRYQKLSTRKERTKAFQDFSLSCEDLFNGLWASVQSKSDLKQLNDLVICPKGAMGGIDDNLIEVFFGMKYHSWNKKVDKSFDITQEAKLIYGARLEYRLTDNGYVLCILSPSKTDNIRHSEDGILLDIIKKPSQLKKKAKWHWKCLIAYMRVTDVDGESTLLDRSLISYLRYTKSCFKDGLSQTRNITSSLNFISHWVVSVGLSGLVIFATTIWINSNTEDQVVLELSSIAKKLDDIKNNQSSLLNRVDKTNDLLETSSDINNVLVGSQVTAIQVKEHAAQVIKVLNKINDDQNKLLLENNKLIKNIQLDTRTK
jgi:hypothetical protein